LTGCYLESVVQRVQVHVIQVAIQVAAEKFCLVVVSVQPIHVAVAVDQAFLTKSKIVWPTLVAVVDVAKLHLLHVAALSQWLSHADAMQHHLLVAVAAADLVLWTN